MIYKGQVYSRLKGKSRILFVDGQVYPSLYSTAAPPSITVQSISLPTVSPMTGNQESIVTFISDVDLAEWEARADGAGVGQGLLVGSGTTLTAGQIATFEVSYWELTSGDKIYRINIYGKNAAGEWTPYV